MTIRAIHADIIVESVKCDTEKGNHERFVSGDNKLSVIVKANWFSKCYRNYSGDTQPQPLKFKRLGECEWTTEKSVFSKRELFML